MNDIFFKAISSVRQAKEDQKKLREQQRGGMINAGLRRGSSHLIRMIGAGGFLRCGLAMIVQAVTAGMKLFALDLKDMKALIDGIRGRSSGLLVLAIEQLNISRVFITACCAETVGSHFLSPTDVAKLLWVGRRLL
jgi:hypothetical protein